MDDVLSFMIEAEELGLLSDTPPRVLSEPPKVKGRCRYCGKPVAQGVFMHEKSCKYKTAVS